MTIDSAPELIGDFHDGDAVLSRSTGARMVVHYDGDPWSARHYDLLNCPHGALASVEDGGNPDVH